MRSSYLAILRLPHARPLLLASLVGRLATATGPLSVVLFVQAKTGSLAQAGAASAAVALASGLLAPVRGRLVDRYGQRRCLPPMALAFAAALTGMVAVAGPGPAAVAATIGLAVAAGAAAPPLGASMRVLWLSLVGQGPRLQAAYSAGRRARRAAVRDRAAAGRRAGHAVPAGGRGAGHGRAGRRRDAGFVASPVSRAQVGSREATAGRAGWAGALRGPGMRTLVLSLAGVGAAIGIWEIGLVGAAREPGSPEAASLLLAAWAAASGVGGLWYGSQDLAPVTRPPLPRPARPARAGPRPDGGRRLAPLALGAVVALVGLVLAPLESSAYVLAAELAPPGTLTESGTWLDHRHQRHRGRRPHRRRDPGRPRPGCSATLAIACVCTAGRPAGRPGRPRPPGRGPLPGPARGGARRDSTTAAGTAHALISPDISSGISEEYADVRAVAADGQGRPVAPGRGAGRLMEAMLEPRLVCLVPAASADAPAERGLPPAPVHRVYGQDPRYEVTLPPLGPETGGPWQSVPVRLSTDQHERLKQWCQANGFTMAVVLRGLVARFLDDQAGRGRRATAPPAGEPGEPPAS